MADEDEDAEPRASWLRVLLVIPFIAVLWVPFFDTAEPRFFGVPFFYAYQMAWILLTSVIIGIVFRAEG